MSVAFRRENDEEHLEPKFERPIAPGPNLVTPRGLALIGAKVVELEAAVADAATEDRDAVLRELRYWHTRQTTAEVVASAAEGEVGIGSTVTYRLNGVERSVVFRRVGSYPVYVSASMASSAVMNRWWWTSVATRKRPMTSSMSLLPRSTHCSAPLTP